MPSGSAPKSATIFFRSAYSRRSSFQRTPARQHPGLEVSYDAGAHVRRPINMNRPIGPRPRQAQLPPSADILLGRARRRFLPGQSVPTADPLGAKNAVQLFQGQLRERIVLMDEDRVSRRLGGRRLAARGHLDFDRIDPPAFIRAVAFERIDRPAHHRDIGAAHFQAVHSGRGALELVGELRLGMKFLEARLPQRHELTHLVAAAAANDAGDFSVRLIVRQRVGGPSRAHQRARAQRQNEAGSDAPSEQALINGLYDHGDPK